MVQGRKGRAEIDGTLAVTARANEQVGWAGSNWMAVELLMKTISTFEATRVLLSFCPHGAVTVRLVCHR